MRACPVKEKRNDMLMWQFDCRQCKADFEVPVPRGPREERELRCLECGSKDIQRRLSKCEIAPPGG